MSERVRLISGLTLLLLSLILCAMSALSSADPAEIRFRSNSRTDWKAGTISVEKNGRHRVNSENAEELQHLHGIGSIIADNLVAEREKNGPFYYPEDLEAVHGIGPRTLDGFRNYIDLSPEESGEQDGIPSFIP